VTAVLVITTDKVYENRESPEGYSEGDRLGGSDPYAASKAAAELLTACFSEAFFKNGERPVNVATARAGNIFGGGDFSCPRLVPDVMRALLAGVTIPITGNLQATRPWQFVLEALAGYLSLSAKLLGPEGRAYAEAWNFGPCEAGKPVRELVDEMIKCWGSGSYVPMATQPIAETHTLQLKSQKAWDRLGWRTCLDLREAVEATIDWYREYRAQRDARQRIDMFGTCVGQIAEYTRRAQESGLAWAAA
jgi:CDP-glucose 4,6-dehydratase